jgi:hypothetical protein
VDATEAKDTTEPAGDKVDTSGDADGPSNIILSVPRNAGEAEDTFVLTRVDVGDPSDIEFVDEFVEEPATRICDNSNRRESTFVGACTVFDPSQVHFSLCEEHQTR